MGAPSAGPAACPLRGRLWVVQASRFLPQPALCRPTDPPAVFSGERWVIVGDSLASGAAGAALVLRMDREGAEAYTISHPGQTTADVLADAPSWKAVRSIGADHLLFVLGTNDCIQLSNTNIDPRRSLPSTRRLVSCIGASRTRGLSDLRGSLRDFPGPASVRPSLRFSGACSGGTSSTPRNSRRRTAGRPTTCISTRPAAKRGQRASRRPSETAEPRSCTSNHLDAAADRPPQQKQNGRPRLRDRPSVFTWVGSTARIRP